MKLARINAIVLKELQDIKTNSSVTVMYVLPIILAMLYKYLIPGLPHGMPLGFGLLILVVMVGMYVPSMMIAEEKEKNTIEVLMLSPAKPTEVLIGKGILTFLSILLTSVILVAVAGNGTAHLSVILVGTVLCSIVSILIGMIVGLLSPNQMATGVYGMPIYLLLLMIPMLSMTGNTIMNTVAKAFPTTYYFDMLMKAWMNDAALRTMGLNVAVLAGSVVVCFAALLVFYRKRGLE